VEGGLINIKKDVIMNCIKCQDIIHPKRLEILPETKTCVECSNTSKWYVRNVISGKTTYCETEIIKDRELAQSISSMDRRAGWGSNLYKVRG
jgi:hypothetical protein